MNADVPALVRTLETGEVAAQREAAEKLARLEAAAQGAAVALVEACASTDDEVRDWAVAALEGIGAPSPSDVARLSKLLGHASLDSAYWAVTLLGRLQSQAAAAAPALAAALENHAEMPVRERAAWALGQVGAAAAPAREALERAAHSDDRRLARLAQEALARL
jgi:HEAT repeat protein